MKTNLPTSTNDIISPTAVGFAGLVVQLAWSRGLVAELRKEAASLGHAAIDDLIAALLAHAAAVMPHVSVPWSVIAAVVRGLPCEPDAKSDHVKSIRGRAACVDRRLKRDHGRALLRLGRSVRASVDAIDAGSVLNPRIVGRRRVAVRATIKVLRIVQTAGLSVESFLRVRAYLAAMPADLVDAADLAYVNVRRSEFGLRPLPMRACA